MRRCSVPECGKETGTQSRCNPHAALNQRERAYRLRIEVRKYKLAQGCADCGYRAHHAGLEFDHRDMRTKRDTVASLSLQGNVAGTWAEIAKCDVVCGTCHNVRIWNRAHPETT